MTKGLNKYFFKQNRQRLMKLWGAGSIAVFTANGLMQKSADTSFKFRQDSSFWYLSGINEPGFVLVIESKNEYLIMPKRSQVQNIFDGALDLNKLSKLSGVAEILDSKTGWERLTKSLQKSKQAGVLAPMPDYIDGLNLFTNPARRTLIKKLKSKSNNLETIDLNKYLRQMRMIKQPAELAAIKEAINITRDSLKIIEGKFLNQKYKNEFEIETDLTRLFFEKGAMGHSFEPIIASGKKACTIHPKDNINTIDYSLPLLMDVGAMVKNYAADLSQTWMGSPSKRFIAVHKSVEEVSKYALTLLKPGVKLKEYEKQIESFMGRHLMTLGLIKANKKAEVRKYYPHAASHFLGLDVHDSGVYDEPLKEGSVLTVEPGIYIPEESIGVRLEQDVLITNDTVKVL